MKYKSKLIKSTIPKTGKIIAIYLIDGTKINIERDGEMGAWLKIGPTPKIILDSNKSEHH